MLTFSWSVGAPTTSESSVNKESQNMVYDVERGDGNVDDVIGNRWRENQQLFEAPMLLCLYF